MKLYLKWGIFLGFGLVVSAISTLKGPVKLIINTDAGGDDAVAILLALEAEKQLQNYNFEIVAITCTYGNTDVINVKNNVLKILTIANQSDIPVYVSVHKPLLKNYTLDYYFGSDGFGDFDFDEEILGQIDSSKHASVAMIDLARQYAGNVSVMTIGPLTNVALAITLDTNFVKNIVRLYVMGSSVHGIGNISPNSEFNFYQDPQSNFIVVNGTWAQPIFLLPWETALFTNIPIKWRKEVLGTVDSRTMKYLNKIERKTLGGPGWNVADAMLCALILRPELITRSLVTNLTPVFDGAGEGTVLVDYANKTNKPGNVEIIESFDVEGFKNLLLDIFSQN